MDLYLNLNCFDKDDGLLINADTKVKTDNLINILDILTGLEFIFEDQSKMQYKYDLTPRERIELYHTLKSNSDLPKLEIVDNSKLNAKATNYFFADTKSNSIPVTADSYLVSKSQLLNDFKDISEFSTYRIEPEDSLFICDLYTSREIRNGKHNNYYKTKLQQLWTKDSEKLLIKITESRLN